MIITNPENHLDIIGASRLAAQIKRYWAEQGYLVHTKLVKYRDIGYGVFKKEIVSEENINLYYHGGIWGVMTDMINGLPKGYKWKPSSSLTRGSTIISTAPGKRIGRG